MNELPQLYIAVVNCTKREVITWPNTPTAITFIRPFIELEFGSREDVGNQCLLNARKAYPVNEGWQHGNVSTFHVSNEKLAQLVKDTSKGVETFKKEFES